MTRCGQRQPLRAYGRAGNSADACTALLAAYELLTTSEDVIAWCYASFSANSNGKRGADRLGKMSISPPQTPRGPTAGKDRIGFGRRLTTGTLGAYAMVIVGNALNFVVAVVMTRWCFGKAGYGVFSFAMAVFNVMCILAGLGVERLLVREVARCLVHQTWGLLHGILRWATRTVGIASLALTAAGLVVVYVLHETGWCEPQKGHALMIALIGLPIFAISILRQSTMRGLHHVLTGIAPDLLVTPVVFLALLLVARLFAARWLTPQSAMALNVLALAVTLVVGILLLRRVLPKQVLAATPEYHSQSWLRSTLPFTLVSGMFVLSSRPSVIMLGLMVDDAAVGAYSAALRGAEIIMLIIVSMNTVLLPTVAHLYAKKDVAQLQRVVTVTVRAVCAVSGVVSILLVVYGRWFLWLFGKEFTVDAHTLSILCLGQFVSSVAAYSANMLTMTGFERAAAHGIAYSAVLNIVGNLVMIPLWGVNGAAIATSFSLVAGNLYMAWVMYQRTGIDVTVLGCGTPQPATGPHPAIPDVEQESP